MITFKIINQVFLLFIVMILVIIYFRYIERRTIFYPSKEIEFNPGEVGLDYQDIYLKTADNVDINAWFIPVDGARYTIFFCHGNAGNISHRLEKIKFFSELGCNVFIFDYRGYGRNKGRPSEKGLYRDAQGAYNYLLSKNIAPQQIVGYGESLGGAVIIDLASRNRLAALVVDSAFTNAKDMVKVIYPFLPYWIFSTRWDSLERIKSIKFPKLIIHSINDEIIPYRLGRRLYEDASLPKEFLEIRGGHNESFFDSRAILREKIQDFLKNLPQ